MPRKFSRAKFVERKMMKHLVGIALILSTFIAVPAAYSDKYQDAKSAWELKDYSKARKLYIEATQEDPQNGEAWYSLASVYSLGDGGVKDETKAFIAYRKAAELGQVYCMSRVADAYYEGRGIEADGNKAIEWYVKYIKNSDDGAPLVPPMIGGIYASGGGGLKPDYVRAYAWLMLDSNPGPQVKKLIAALEKEMSPAAIKEAKALVPGIKESIKPEKRAPEVSEPAAEEEELAEDEEPETEAAGGLSGQMKNFE